MSAFEIKDGVRKSRFGLSERGIALPVVLVMTLILTAVTGGFAWLVSSNMQMTRLELYSNRALFSAEAGLHQAMFHIRQDFLNAANRDTAFSDNDINGFTVDSQNPANVWDGTPNFAVQNWYVLPLILPTGETPLQTGGEGTYQVQLLNVTGFPRQLFIRSAGTYRGETRIIVSQIRMVSVSPWENTVYAGGSGGTINGNAMIHGSVHLLGQDGATVLDFGGGAGIRNNYGGIPDSLRNRIPALPQVSGEDTLNAEFRLRNGMVKLEGNGTIGDDPTLASSAKKATMDGVYANNNWLDWNTNTDFNDTESRVFSDNLTKNGYDMGNAARFPTLDDEYEDPVTGTVYLSVPSGGTGHRGYLLDVSVHVPGAVILDDNNQNNGGDGAEAIWELVNASGGDQIAEENGWTQMGMSTDTATGTTKVTYDANGDGLEDSWVTYNYTPIRNDRKTNFGDFSIVSSLGSDDGVRDELEWDASNANLKIGGIITATGGVSADGDLKSIKPDGPNEPGGVRFSGNGTFFAAGTTAGNIALNSSVLTHLGGGNNSFPNLGRIGFIAENNIELGTGGGDAQLHFTGAFYAQNMIKSAKQNNVAGTFVAQTFDQTGQVPSIFQVPALAGSLPPGMPDLTGAVLVPSFWREIFED
ncbi:MAG: hypothetical protein HYY14_04710 [Candidatus Omnitrophica bacterium]|nr:hypothetical protein [Candidatus Omnitrophota bacterium]